MDGQEALSFNLLLEKNAASLAAFFWVAKKISRFSPLTVTVKEAPSCTQFLEDFKNRCTLEGLDDPALDIEA
jgi:hypothetical protein